MGWDLPRVILMVFPMVFHLPRPMEIRLHSHWARPRVTLMGCHSPRRKGKRLAIRLHWLTDFPKGCQMVIRSGKPKAS
jgi:hypothetical protein